MTDARKIKVAVISGGMDWSYRTTCSGDRFDADIASAYVTACTARLQAHLEEAADAGAKIVLCPEYCFGAEAFSPIPEAQARQLAVTRTSPALAGWRRLCMERQLVICGSANVDHGAHGVHQTGILIDEAGDMHLQVKHPRMVPDPVGWPFDTSPRVYPTGCATVGITICSDCTHDPGLPLAMSKLGMEILLLPGCGFAGDKWKSFLVVRARDTQCPVLYADHRRAAIVDQTGDILSETDQADKVIVVELSLKPKKCSPDARE